MQRRVYGLDYSQHKWFAWYPVTAYHGDVAYLGWIDPEGTEVESNP